VTEASAIRDGVLKSRDALVVGASRGVGLALAEALAAGEPGGVPRRLFVTHRGDRLPASLVALRDSARCEVVPLACELTSDEEVAGLGRQLAEAEATLAVTIHAAGILHEDGLMPEKALRQVDRRALSRVFDINAFAPLLVAQAVLSRIPRQGPSHFAALSAMVGSIGDNRIGGWYSYRASKAALNQLLRTLAIEAKRTHPELCVTSIHPGTTDTDLSRPFQGNVPDGKLYTPARSARRILDVVLSGTPDASGRFMNWNGEALPW
jgi:NAD(P)-dependent dehydrogenase (short-subunit alcohol dehydrogenase family)